MLFAMAGFTGLAFGGKLPKHRGPLKPVEVKRIVRNLAKTTVVEHESAARSWLEARARGAMWSSDKFVVLGEKGTMKLQVLAEPSSAMPGDSVFLVERKLLPAGKSSFTRDDVDQVTHARFQSGDAIDIFVNAFRYESGKPGPTNLMIDFARGPAGERLNNPLTYILEIRSSPANGKTSRARMTTRSYRRGQWIGTIVEEDKTTGRSREYRPE